MVAVWKSDLVGSDIDPLHGVFGERAANRGWGPWFLRNLALRRHHPICLDFFISVMLFCGARDTG